MKKYFFDFSRILFSSFVIWLFLILPESVFGFIRPDLTVCWHLNSMGMLFLLAFMLSMVKNKTFFVRFLSVFGALQIIQFVSMAYRGTYLDAQTIDALFFKTGDVFAAAKPVWYKYLYLLILVGMPYSLLGYVVSRDILNRIAFKGAWFFVLLFFGFIVYQSTLLLETEQTPFKQGCYASFNTINSVSAYFGKVLPQKLKGNLPKFVKPVDVDTLSVLEGESVAAEAVKPDEAVDQVDVTIPVDQVDTTEVVEEDMSETNLNATSEL